MPQEGVTNIVKVVNFITAISFFQCFVLRCLHNLSREDGPLEIDSICYIDFAVVDKVVRTLKIFDRFFEEGDVQTALCKVIFISSLLAPISCVEVRRDFFTANDPDIFREESVHHLAVLNWCFVCSWFGPEVEGNDVSHGGDTLVCAACSGERRICGKWSGNETDCMHNFEDILFNTIVVFCLATHPVVVPAQIANFKRVFFVCWFFEQFIYFVLIGRPDDLLFVGLVIIDPVPEAIVVEVELDGLSQQLLMRHFGVLFGFISQICPSLCDHLLDGYFFYLLLNLFDWNINFSFVRFLHRSIVKEMIWIYNQINLIKGNDSD